MTAPREDYYQVLGVPRDASTPEIRRAYRRLARRHHPDRNPQPESSARFRALVDAYAALSDPARRARYDDTIAAQRRPRPPSRPPGAARLGTLELSRHEAALAAVAPLTLVAADGSVIVLPAGIRGGDRITLGSGGDLIALTIRVNRA